MDGECERGEASERGGGRLVGCALLVPCWRSLRLLDGRRRGGAAAAAGAAAAVAAAVTHRVEFGRHLYIPGPLTWLCSCAIGPAETRRAETTSSRKIN